MVFTNTNKLAVAMLTLSVVSSVVATNPEQKETFWSKTKKFFAPVKYESADKKKELLDSFPTDAETIKHYKEVTLKGYAQALENSAKDHKAAVEKLEKDAALVADAKKEAIKEENSRFKEEQQTIKDHISDLNWHLGVRGKIYKQYVNHPNWVKYGAMSAVAAAVTTAGVLAYKYELPQKALNKIKSLFATKSN